jgi:hypothetical protein
VIDSYPNTLRILAVSGAGGGDRTLTLFFPIGQNRQNLEEKK